jgi:glucosylceramidase
MWIVPTRIEKSLGKVAAFIFPVLVALVLPHTHAQSVNVWLTTDDQSIKLQQQASVTFTAGTGGTNPVVVDETQTYQQIEGFGASMTDSAAYLLNEVATASARSNAMFRLFTRIGSGIGVSFLRNPMGASDIARWDYSYDDLPPGQTDTNLTSFSIAHDQADIIPLLQQALQLNPQLKLMANPWSPPGWMKDSGSMIGGALLPAMYGPFANYFVKYIQAYQALGLPTHYVSLQNEPLYVPGNYPGMSMNAATQLTVLRDYVLPAFASNNITTKVLVYDHNWDRPDYPTTLFSDPTVLASSQVAGTAWHGYGGTPGAMLSLANQFPGKGNYETEHSGGTWVSDQVRSDFEEIIHVMRSWGRTYVKWSLALDQNHGPNSGGCNTCNPLVTVNTNTGAVNNAIEFYTLGHFSKFVLPGAYRIYSGNAAGVVSAAFLNPDGSKALVAFNDSPNSQTFQVQWGSRSFSYSLPGYAGATFTWTGTQTGAYTLNPTNQNQASSFNSVSGLRTEATSDMLGGYDLGYANGGYYAAFQNVDFGLGFTNASLRVASAGSGGNLQFRLDSATGPIIGVLPVPVTGGWQTWQTVTGSVSGASGLHNLYLVFQGGSGIGNLNWFQFSGAIPATLALPAPWVSADIGTVGYAGSATFSSGVFSVVGSGADIESIADEFRYVSQPVSGICEIRARVTSIQNTDPWAKAGVMLRESTAPGAINAAVLVTPGNGVTFQRRTSTGGTTSVTVVSGVTAPRWVRLARYGNSFSAYYSSDGNTWTQLGSTAGIAMNSSTSAGLAVTAHNDTTNCVATFDNVFVNQAPVLAPVPPQAILAGKTLLVTNSATDADIPAQTLSFGLLNAPAGAVINTNSGLFTRRPAVAFSPTTQSVAVVVSDNGVPSLSATQNFVITVTRPAQPTITGLSVTNGQFGFWIYGDTGPDYTVQISTNLTAWSTLGTWTSPVPPFFWSDTNSNPGPVQFYRALLGP